MNPPTEPRFAPPQVPAPRLLALTGFGVCFAVALSMLFVDRPLALWMHVHGPRMADLQRFFSLATQLGKGGPYYGGTALAALAAYLLSRSARFAGLRARLPRLLWSCLFYASAMLASGIVLIAMKVLIGRLRPEYLFSQGFYGFEPLNLHFARLSFPSGHTETAAAAMTGLYLMRPRAWPACVIVVVMVAASRVYLTEHYLADVLMGAYVGIAVTSLVYLRMLRSGRPLYGAPAPTGGPPGRA